MTAAPDTSKGTSVRFMLLTGCFVLVALAWIVHAILTKFDVAFASSVPFWKVTEVSSIIVTLVVSVAFWITYIIGGPGHTAILKGADPFSPILWFVCLLIFAIGFGVAAYIACTDRNIVVQIISLAMGALAAVQIGRVSMRTTFASLKKCKIQLELIDDEQERKTIAREVVDKINARDNISKFLCFSDIPIAFAMVMVSLLVVLWTFILDSDKEMRVFIAGAVALQLLYSNSVYWIEAFADTPRGRGWLDHLSAPFQTVKRMLLPEECPNGMTIVDWAVSKLNELFPPNGSDGTIETKPLASMPSSQQTETDGGLVSTTTDGEE